MNNIKEIEEIFDARMKIYSEASKLTEEERIIFFEILNFGKLIEEEVYEAQDEKLFMKKIEEFNLKIKDPTSRSVKHFGAKEIKEHLQKFESIKLFRFSRTGLPKSFLDHYY